MWCFKCETISYVVAHMAIINHKLVKIVFSHLKVIINSIDTGKIDIMKNVNNLKAIEVLSE